MPTYKKGDMFSVLREVDHFIITTNAIVKSNGALVMGAGIAKQVRDGHPESDLFCGDAVKHWKSQDDVYGFIETDLGSLCLFQVKKHYKDQASIELIMHSTAQLKLHAEKHPHQSYALNFPGIGNGKLSYDQVKPIVDQLPDNVQVWTFN